MMLQKRVAKGEKRTTQSTGASLEERLAVPQCGKACLTVQQLKKNKEAAPPSPGLPNRGLAPHQWGKALRLCLTFRKLDIDSEAPPPFRSQIHYNSCNSPYKNGLPLSSAIRLVLPSKPL
jgi:hypothetical protein